MSFADGHLVAIFKYCDVKGYFVAFIGLGSYVNN